MESPPQFRYSPNAYTLGLFEEAPITCECCQQPRGWRYKPQPYARAKVRNLCPWCIADGSAARKWDASFVQDFVPDEVVSPESLDEVLHRTPGYVSWQGENWFAHCGEACTFIGYVGAADVREFWDELVPDIIATGSDPDLVAQDMEADGSVVGYLFRCRQCGAHRLHVDCD